MTKRFSWRVASRIAWREARASSGRFFFVILAVAAGVGALTGVRGFSRSFRDMLLRDARTLLAGDLSVRVFHTLTPEEEMALNRLDGQGIERAWITETVSAMSSPGSSRPILVSVKAVEPGKYPFYGSIELRPPGDLASTLATDAIAASEELLLRLGVSIGDRVRLGDAEFRVAAAVVVEPDRMTGSLNVGPRVMVSREGLEHSGLIKPGSRAAQRYLFRLPPEGPSIAQVRRSLEEAFPGARIVDFRETHPTIRRGLNRATNFLSLVSLIALVVGALGVAMAIHSHLQQKLDTIAIMKCLGASSTQIIGIYLLQTLAIGLLGSAAGILLGYVVQAWFPSLIAAYFPTPPQLDWQPVAAVQGLAIGLLTTLLFTLPPLLGIRKVRPALIFRREMERPKQTWRERLKTERASLACGAALVLSIGVIAAWLGESLRLGAWFAGGLLVSLLALSGLAWLLLRFLRLLPKLVRRRLSPSLRHGIANLHRPGVHAEAVLVALGVGVTFMLSVYLIQTSVLQQMVLSAPPDMPNVFFVNITGHERDDLLELVQRHPGVEGKVELVPSVAARLVSVDGVPIEQIAQDGPARRYQGTRTITWRETQPEHMEVLQGAWWDSPAGAGGREPLVSVQEDTAEVLHLRVGSEIEWTVAGQAVQAKVAAIHRAEAIRPGSTIRFILTPEALAGLPATYYGAARIAPSQAGELLRAAFERFPSVTVINAADVLEIVQEVVDQIAIVIRFISAFAIVAGLVILVSSVVATRFRRIQEVAILKTLGATRRRVSSIFSVEFLIVGLAAGFMGSLLATAFSGLLLEQVLDAQFRFDPLPNAVCIVGTALLANAAGWLASFRILGKKPLEVLRGE